MFTEVTNLPDCAMCLEHNAQRVPAFGAIPLNDDRDLGLSTPLCHDHFGSAMVWADVFIEDATVFNLVLSDRSM